MTNNSKDKAIVIKVTNNEKEKSLEEIQKKINSSDYIDSINKISSNLTQLSTSLIEMQQSSIPYILQQNNEMFSKLSQTAQSISKMYESVMPEIIESSNKLSKSLQNIINSYDFDNLINIAVSTKLQNIISQLLDSIKPLDNERLSGYETEYLKRMFWVIPYEYNYKDINKITTLNKKQFETQIIKHLNKKRTTQIFNKCIKNEPDKDKRRLLKQAKQNYFLSNYSICNMGLTSYLDSLTLNLIDDSSYNQHTSYKVIYSIHEYYEEHDTYQMYLKAEVLKNFYEKLYSNAEDLKNPKTNTLNRNLLLHCSKCLNKQIDSLRLINAIYYIQCFIDETNFSNRFILEKKGKNKSYKLKEESVNNFV